MNKNKQTASQLKDLLTVCLAKAIDTALVAQFGDCWFNYFLQEDQAKEDSRAQITRKGQSSIRDFDTQALLKFLRYCTNWSDYVLIYYGVYNSNDQFSNQAQSRQLRSLLDRLITDFRNQIEAHNRVADIELELEHQQVERIYGYKEAAQDMIKLASLFKIVCNRNGVSYYDKMCELYEPKKKKWIIPLIVSLLVIVIMAVIYIPILMTDNTKTPPTEGNVYYNPNNIYYTPDTVSINPKHVYYDGNDIVAICYVINGTTSKVNDIYVDHLTLSNDEGIIAEAAFGTMDNVTIAPNAYTSCTLRFKPNTINMNNADLRYLEFESNCTFNKE